MSAFPVLAEFLEEQLWALRDRAEGLKAAPLPESMAVKLAVVSDEIADAGVLLRRPTRTNREGVLVLIAQMRTMLEEIERAAWPTAAPPDAGNWVASQTKEVS